MNIAIDLMIKDGGTEVMVIPSELLEPLAKSIRKNGVETVRTDKSSYEVVGLMVRGNQTGQRVIVLGMKQGEDERE